MPIPNVESVSSPPLKRLAHHKRAAGNRLLKMPKNARQLSFATFPTMRQKLLHNVLKSNTRCIMSYDPVETKLVPYYWYVTVSSASYQPFTVAIGPSGSSRVCHRQSYANTGVCISTRVRGVYVRCWRRKAKEGCSQKQQYI